MVSDAALEAAADLGSATLHEAAGRIGNLPCEIRSRTVLEPAVAGRALPVLVPCGDNLWLHRALEEATPGDVLVVEVGQGIDYGYWGEVMAVAAQARGVLALVIDGGVRDVLPTARLGFPVYSRSVSVRGTVKDPRRPGSVGAPVTLGGVLVHRGDLVVADADGVVVIPADDAEQVIAAGRTRAATEEDYMNRLRAGELTLDVLGLR